MFGNSNTGFSIYILLNNNKKPVKTLWQVSRNQSHYSPSHLKGPINVYVHIVWSWYNGKC